MSAQWLTWPSTRIAPVSGGIVAAMLPLSPLAEAVGLGASAAVAAAAGEVAGAAAAGVMGAAMASDAAFMASADAFAVAAASASTDAFAVAAAAAFFLVSFAASSPHRQTLAGHVPVAHVVAHQKSVVPCTVLTHLE